MTLRILMMAVLTALTGCASVMNDTTHGMKVETKSASGETVTGADCKFSNDYGTTTGKSGDVVTVRRSSKDLEIVCKAPNNADASGRAVSRTNGGMWGNILIGGGIGAVIDHNRGTAYTYPTWVQLVFGKSLTFDRRDEKDGQPTLGVEPGTATATATATSATPAVAAASSPTAN